MEGQEHFFKIRIDKACELSLKKSTFHWLQVTPEIFFKIRLDKAYNIFKKSTFHGFH